MVPLKYLKSRTFEMPLIDLEIILHLNWSKKSATVPTAVSDQDTTFSISDTKLYVSVVTLSTQGDTKLFEQLKSGFERTINWSKDQSKNQ